MPVATMCIEDDKVLVGRFQEGEAAIFDELYTRHVDRVYNIAYRLVGDTETARDICQETFVRVYHNLGRFRFEAKFTTWLYSIVLNMARSFYRKKKWTSIDEIPPQASGGDGSDFVNGIARSEAKRKVRSYVCALPEREREALVLRHYEGLSCKEAAEVMGCAPETIRTLSFFAIKKLRVALRKEGYEL